MSIGMCIDFIEEWIEINKPQKDKVRQARQKDFDSF
jgi:hypothetical protein